MSQHSPTPQDLDLPAVLTERSRRPALVRQSLRMRLLHALATPGGGVVILVLLLLVAVIQANPRFGEPGHLIRFIGRTAPIAIAAIGQYFVIVSGEFDLSMGAVVTAQVVLSGHLIGQDESRIIPVLILMLLLAVGIGLINGLATTILKVPSFIVTLGTMLGLSGMTLWLTGGAATGNPVDSFRQIGRGGIRDVPVVDVIPYPVIILVAIGIGAAVLMRRPYGRTLIAAGDNPEAARLAGSSLWWLKTRAFILSALAASVSGILLVGYAGVHPSVGQGYEFTAITAVVLGGVVLGGGRGWVLSAAAGAFALELLFTLMNFLGIASTWRPTVQGAIIIIAVAVAGRAWRAAPFRRRNGRSAQSAAPTGTPGTGTTDTDTTDSGPGQPATDADVRTPVPPDPEAPDGPVSPDTPEDPPKAVPATN